jgi:crossover junction endodeoxyribonuclease RuvC
MTRYLGVDPGLSGALAIVETVNDIPMLVDATDMPCTGSGTKARVDVIAAAEWIAKHAPSTAYIERAQAFPGRGARSGFVYGRSVGSSIELSSHSTAFLTASSKPQWKRRLHLNKDKEAARQRALQLFPSQHALLARMKDHGRAETALIVVASRLERMP